MILNDPEPCTVMYFQSSSPPPHKKKVLSTILNDTLEEEEKIINYGHRIDLINLTPLRTKVLHVGDISI